MASRIWGSRRRRVIRRLVNRGIFALLVAAVFWSVGLVWFAETMPGAVADPDTRTEAIVVLTGGSGRLDEGFRLFDRGLAGKIFVSGLYRGIDVKALLNRSRRDPTSLDCCLGIGYAEDTVGNALETTEWLKKNGLKSIRLVTAAYHMRRALLEFRHAYPGIEIVAHPVFPGHVKQNRWWAWPGTSGLIVSEYNKYLVAWARLRFIGAAGGAINN